MTYWRKLLGDYRDFPHNTFRVCSTLRQLLGRSDRGYGLYARTSPVRSSTRFATPGNAQATSKIVHLGDALPLLREVCCNSYLSRDVVSAALPLTPPPTGRRVSPYETHHTATGHHGPDLVGGKRGCPCGHQDRH